MLFPKLMVARTPLLIVAKVAMSGNLLGDTAPYGFFFLNFVGHRIERCEAKRGDHTELSHQCLCTV